LKYVIGPAWYMETAMRCLVGHVNEKAKVIVGNVTLHHPNEVVSDACELAEKLFVNKLAWHSSRRR
jgi:L-rhamnose isomerase